MSDIMSKLADLLFIAVPAAVFFIIFFATEKRKRKKLIPPTIPTSDKNLKRE